MYATYCAHIAALGWASSRRIWPLRLPLRSLRIVGAALAVVGGGIARPCPGGTNVAITPQLPVPLSNVDRNGPTMVQRIRA